MDEGSIPCTCSHRIAFLHSDGKLRISSLGVFAAQVRHLFSHPSIIHIRMHTHLPTHLLPALPPHPRTNIPTLPPIFETNPQPIRPNLLRNLRLLIRHNTSPPQIPLAQIPPQQIQPPLRLLKLPIRSSLQLPQPHSAILKLVHNDVETISARGRGVRLFLPLSSLLDQEIVVEKCDVEDFGERDGGFLEQVLGEQGFEEAVEGPDVLVGCADGVVEGGDGAFGLDLDAAEVSQMGSGSGRGCSRHAFTHDRYVVLEHLKRAVDREDMWVPEHVLELGHVAIEEVCSFSHAGLATACPLSGEAGSVCEAKR